MMEDVFEALVGGIEKDLGLARAVEWCGSILKEAWDGDRDYFVRHSCVGRENLPLASDLSGQLALMILFSASPSSRSP